MKVLLEYIDSFSVRQDSLLENTVIVPWVYAAGHAWAHTGVECNEVWVDMPPDERRVRPDSWMNVNVKYRQADVQTPVNWLIKSK